jgi:hypothetical protein
VSDVIKDIKKLCEYWVNQYNLQMYPEHSTFAKWSLSEDILDIIKDAEEDEKNELDLLIDENDDLVAQNQKLWEELETLRIQRNELW